MSGRERRYLPVIEKDVSRKVDQKEIVYLMQDLRDVDICMNGSFKMRVRGKVDDFSGQLSREFFKCHSYLIINLARVESMENCTLTFDTGEVKHVGRNSFFRIRKAFNEYLENVL